VNSFDDRAATWDDDPAKLDRATVVAEVICDAIDLDGSQRVLEYGAGTGLVTQALGNVVGPATLVDTSEGMRNVMLAKIAAGAITDARVWDLDLESAPVPDERFDLIVTVLTLHHLHDIGGVLAKFAQMLASDGHLCIVDLDAEDGSFHGVGFDGHHGFDRTELGTTLTTAGFADVQFRECSHMVRDDASYPMFLATCRVAAPESASSD
jgi:ubiquinone/menaquinone biosynthesis C-methylase UbiE